MPHTEEEQSRPPLGSSHGWKVSSNRDLPSSPHSPMPCLCPTSPSPRGGLSCRLAPVPSSHLLFQALFSESGASGRHLSPSCQAQVLAETGLERK